MQTTEPRNPEVTVELTGRSGNVFAIIGSVSRSMKRAGLVSEAKAFGDAAMKCESYDDVLRLAMATVSVE